MNYKLLFVVLLAWSCSGGEKKEESAAATASVNAMLDPAAFKEQLSTDDNAIVLDVRTPAEVAEGTIPGAIVIDFTAPDFADKIGGLEKDKDYYVYCKGGGRSSKAATQMESLGFSKIYNLKGGYDAWVENGFETALPE
jgi:rhodanese-related sulfurtransferase